MSVLADTPGAPAVLGTNREKHVPYTVYLNVNVQKGKRFERIRDLKRKANEIEDDLETIECDGTTNISFDFTKPVAFTRQYGDIPPRFSFHGHICHRSSFVKAPVGERVVINSGEYKTGPGASNRSNRVPDTELDQIASAFKDLIETTTGCTMQRLELARYIYGRGGVHFPR
jgi:hypothetical protein